MPTNTSSDMELAQALSPLQIRILKGLRERGSGMLLDLSARALSFPDEIAEPLTQLQEWGLASGNATQSGAFGNTLFSITPRGMQVLRQSENMPAGDTPYRSTSARSANPKIDLQKQQLDLLERLAEVEQKRGNLDDAANYYKRALDVSQQLSATLREGE